MLKFKWRYLGVAITYALQIVALSGIVYASAPLPAAVGNSLVIYQLQTGSASAATQEYISLSNNSSDAVDVTGYCVTKSAGTDSSQTQLGCLVSSQPNVKIMLPANGIITLATPEFIAAHTNFVPDISFANTLASTSGHVRILDDKQQELDRIGWGTATHPEGAFIKAPASGKILQRKPATAPLLQDTSDNSADFAETTLTTLPATTLYEEEIAVDICPSLEGLQTTLPAGYLFDTANNCQPDACNNIDGLQIDVPDGYAATDAICTIIPLENAVITITELLPNAASYDTGQEFIELYNPNDRPINLKGYVLQLGPAFDKPYTLPEEAINPGAYLAFSDTITKLVLPNTTGSLRLIAPDGSTVSQTESYTSPADSTSWALIGTTWQYTNRPTASAANLANLAPAAVEAATGDEEVSSLSPCPAGQYRYSVTNRCRLIEVSTASLTPCQPGQQRNPETNRCRSTALVAAVNSLVPCKANQERNPETNRCKSTESTNALADCAEGQERNPETNRCRKVGSTLAATTGTKVQDVATGTIKNNARWLLAAAALLAAVSYAAYEWRRDITNIFLKHRLKKT